MTNASNHKTGRKWITANVLGHSEHLYHIDVTSRMANAVRAGSASALRSVARIVARQVGIKGTARAVTGRQVQFTKADRRFGGEHVMGTIVVNG